MVDEVHIRPTINTHLSYGTHGFDSETNDLARTIVAFMVKSVYGPYKEVVKLIPKFRESSNNLFNHTNDVFKFLLNMGVNIVSIISDNNAINVKMYKNFGITGSNCFYIRPLLIKKTFFMFDPVHIFKNIRNNWIKDPPKSKKPGCEFTKTKYEIVFYVILNGKKVKKCANFQHLFELHKESENQPLKISHCLTLKALFPSDLEKQKVSLAKKILNRENSTGLKYLAGKNNRPEYLDTAYFIEMFADWFDVLNVKTPDKHINLKNELLMPVSSFDSPNLKFLINFREWILLQGPLKTKFLASPTYNAVLLTTRSILQCAHYLLQNNLKKIMLGMFQSDPIEKRFGLYRSMQGSNYHLDAKSIFQAETKLRMSSLINLKKSSEEIQDNLCEIFNDNINADDVQPSLVVNFARSIFCESEYDNVKCTDQNIIYFIGGYIVKKYFENSNSCIDCKYSFKNRNIDDSFVEEFKKFLESNKYYEFYCHPTQYLVQKLFCLDYIINALTCGNMAQDFHRKLSGNQKFKLIIELFDTQLDVEEDTCLQGHSLKVVLLELFKRYINTFLNRFSDLKNDYRSKNNLRKLLVFSPDKDNKDSILDGED